MESMKASPEVLAWMRRIGSLGGKARKAALSPEELTAISLLANKARQKALPKARRVEIARHAATIRWGKKGQT